MIKKILKSTFLDKAKRNISKLTGLNIKIKKLSPSSCEDYRLVKILSNFSFDTVVDIGANKGQFATSLLDYGFKGKIVSFEPTSTTYQTLLKKAKGINNWKIAEQQAIGDVDGEIEINISKDSLFNSIKSIKKEYTDVNTSASIQNSEKVKISKLDSIYKNYFSGNENILLKIDTQGYEKEVLTGASEFLKLVKGIKMEIPLVPIYENVNWLLDDILQFFKDNGFRCVSLSEVAVNKETGIVHEIDGIFLKESLL